MRRTAIVSTSHGRVGPVDVARSMAWRYKLASLRELLRTATCTRILPPSALEPCRNQPRFASDAPERLCNMLCRRALHLLFNHMSICEVLCSSKAKRHVVLQDNDGVTTSSRRQLELAALLGPQYCTMHF